MSKELSWHHWKNGLYFAREEDGSVRVVKTTGKPPIGVMVIRIFDITIEVSEWASIIASLSAGGITTENLHAALDFHVGPQKR